MLPDFSLHRKPTHTNVSAPGPHLRWTSVPQGAVHGYPDRPRPRRSLEKFKVFCIRVRKLHAFCNLDFYFFIFTANVVDHRKQLQKISPWDIFF